MVSSREREHTGGGVEGKQYRLVNTRLSVEDFNRLREYALKRGITDYEALRELVQMGLAMVDFEDVVIELVKILGRRVEFMRRLYIELMGSKYSQ